MSLNMSRELLTLIIVCKCCLICPPSVFRRAWKLKHRKSFVFNIAFSCSQCGTVTRAELHAQTTGSEENVAPCVTFIAVVGFYSRVAE